MDNVDEIDAELEKFNDQGAFEIRKERMFKCNCNSQFLGIFCFAALLNVFYFYMISIKEILPEY